MDYKIREIAECDRNTVAEMMHTFYASDAVATNGSAEIFKNDIDACLSDSPYLEGYIIEINETAIGYGMLAKSFSTEYGKPCIWIEDLYIKEEYRGLGIGSAFFAFVGDKHPSALLRLEVEAENERARKAYEKNGFDYMPYLEMKK